MKRTLCLFTLLLFTTVAWGMGEKRTVTDKGTPIFPTALEQYSYAQEQTAVALSNKGTAAVEKAFNACRDLRMLFPGEQLETARSYFLEGQLYSLNKATRQAQEVLDKFLASVPSGNLAPEKAEAQYLLGLNLQEEKALAKAKLAYAKVESSYPAETASILKARQGSAECLELEGDLMGATNLLEDTLKLYPADDYTKAHINLKIGLLIQRLGYPKLAVGYYQKVLALPDSDEIKGPRTAAKLALEQLEVK